MAKKRTTLHNGRSGKSGTFRANHNDRSDEKNSAEHIDKAQSDKNIYRSVGSGDQNFEQAELDFYEKNFGVGLAEKNLRYMDQRHFERVKSIEDMYRDSKTAPEESLMQIGNRNEKIDPDLLDQIVRQQLDWEQKTFPQVRYLSYAEHLDEPDAAPHVHARRVFMAHDKNGNWIPNERKALEEMGVERPDLKKKEGRYNNAKMTYTAKCREHFQELCREHGIEIEDEPREKGKSGRALDRLKTETLKEEIKDLEAKKQRLEVQGNEHDHINEAERVAKERPVMEGGLFQKKELVGYQVSPEWLDATMRLARLGVQAADERDAREEAEKKADQASQREKAANAEAARLRVDNDMLRDELRKKEKDFLGSKKSVEIWDRAPEQVKEDFREWERQYSHENQCMMAFVGRLGARYGVDKAEQNPVVGMCCRELGAKNQDEERRMIRELTKICKKEKKPEKEQLWSDKASMKIFEKTMQQIKRSVEQVAQQLKAQGLEAAAMKYLEEHQEIYAEPWETLTEQRKDEIRAKQRYIDEY